MDESLLHRIWRDQLFHRSGLLTEDGRRVEVIFPGRWNGSAGPDFAGARVRIGGEERTGDVEVHWRREAWFGHGHDADPAYDGVILHVVMHRNVHPGEEAPLRTRSGRDVPELVLEPLLAEGLRGLAAALGPARGPAVAAAPAGVTEEGEARGRALRASGWARVGERARRLRARAAAFGPDEAFFRGYLEALGYRWNAGPAYEVARRIGWERLRRLFLPAPVPERAGMIESIFRHVAGWNADGSLVPGLLSLVPEVRPLDPSLWRRAGIRPANRPERRLAGGALWLSKRMEQGLWEWLRSAWESHVGASERLSVGTSESGSTRLTTGRRVGALECSQSDAAPARLGPQGLKPAHPPTLRRSDSQTLLRQFVVPGRIGPDRAGVIWANAAAPMLFAWLEDRRDEDGLRRLREILDAEDGGGDVLTRAWEDRWGGRAGSVLARQGVYAISKGSGC